MVHCVFPVHRSGCQCCTETVILSKLSRRYVWHIVGVDEITHQYRLLFSRAEIVQLNSWIPVQQVVYSIIYYESSSRQSD